MQLLDRIQTTLSVDTSSNPQNILFKNVEDTTDTSLLTEFAQYNQPFPVATTALSMGTIATGKFLYVKPAADCSLIFNGGVEQILFRGGKVSKLWVDFTSLSIVVTGAPNQVQIVIAGA